MSLAHKCNACIFPVSLIFDTSVWGMQLNTQETFSATLAIHEKGLSKQLSSKLKRSKICVSPLAELQLNKVCADKYKHVGVTFLPIEGISVDVVRANK